MAWLRFGLGRMPGQAIRLVVGSRHPEVVAARADVRRVDDRRRAERALDPPVNTCAYGDWMCGSISSPTGDSGLGV